MDYAPWEGKKMGAYGEGAGAAYVFSRSPAVEGYVWEQDQVRAVLSMVPVVLCIPPTTTATDTVPGIINSVFLDDSSSMLLLRLTF